MATSNSIVSVLAGAHLSIGTKKVFHAQAVVRAMLNLSYEDELKRLDNAEVSNLLQVIDDLLDVSTDHLFRAVHMDAAKLEAIGIETAIRESEQVPS